MNETLAKTVRILWGVAFSIIILSCMSWAMGRKLAMRQYLVAGFYLLAVAAVPALIATLLWAVDWIKRNVKIL
jgi:hypothetical protein